jgi:RHS repeat-associated protein
LTFNVIIRSLGSASDSFDVGRAAAKKRAYGNLLGAVGPLAEANTYRFSSKEYLPNAGLYYYGFRFYEPNLQRWLNRAPIAEKGGINLYEVLGNNGVNEADGFGWKNHNAVPVVQWHHPIPCNNSTYQFHLHPLITGAGWTQDDLKFKQTSILLSGHAGPHCDEYLDSQGTPESGGV